MLADENMREKLHSGEFGGGQIQILLLMRKVLPLLEGGTRKRDGCGSIYTHVFMSYEDHAVSRHKAYMMPFCLQITDHDFDALAVCAQRVSVLEDASH